jgi:polar amino acid transport system permease protein
LEKDVKGWNWEGFFEYLTNYYLFEGAMVTLGLTVFAMTAGLALGFVIAVMRMSKYRFLSGPAYFYTWIFRGTPLLVQLIIIYTGLPQLGIKLTVLQSTLIGLSLCEAAYLSEIVRAGIAAVPKGQINAARAIGMTEAQVMRYIVAPQAFRIIIPPLGNYVDRLHHFHGGAAAPHAGSYPGKVPRSGALHGCGPLLPRHDDRLGTHPAPYRETIRQGLRPNVG